MYPLPRPRFPRFNTRFWLVSALVLFTALLEGPCVSWCRAEAVQVSVSIPPLKWLSDQIGGDLVDCQVLVEGGREPHTFSPTPGQMARLFRARIYFSLGMEFDRRIDRKIRHNAPRILVVNLDRNIEKIPLASGQGHTGPDPHTWLSPANLKIMAATMAAALEQVDPKDQQTFRRNLQQTVQLLDRLHGELRSLLSPCQGRSLYVFHPAFAYFAHAYGLRQEAVEMEGKAPTPARFARLVSSMQRQGTRVVFVQPGFDQKSIRAIARAIGGRVVTLDPLAEDVAANLKAMATTIRSSLCP